MATQTPVSKQSSGQLRGDLLATRDGVRVTVARCAGVISPMVATNDSMGTLCAEALKKTVDNGWLVDFPDALLALQGKKASFEDSVALPTELTNKIRNPKRAAADGHYYIDCADSSQCSTKPFTEEELSRALGARPITAAMNENRAVHLTNPTAAVVGYLSASLHPNEYAWPNADGSPMSLLQTVSGMSSEVPESATRGAFKQCLQSNTDDSMQTCAKAGIRTALFDRVKKVASR